MANRFLNNIKINDSYTLPVADGTANQVIKTDGLGELTFIDQGSLEAGSAEATHILVKNTSGSQIAKGTPVYVTGETGNSGKIEIAPADASDETKMPALGLLETTLNNNAEGYCVQGGLLEALATATIDGTSTAANDTVYIKAGGGLTMTKPTGSNLIQNIAKIARVHASNGSLVVSSILRTNDVPNLSTGKIWVGDGNTIESTVVHLDETNGRIGIGTTSPATKLHIGTSSTSGTTTEEFRIQSGTSSGNGGTAIANLVTGAFGTSGIYFGNQSTYTSQDAYLKYADSNNTTTLNFSSLLNLESGSAGSRMYINPSGNVGIGTTSPSQKLHVAGNARITGAYYDSTNSPGTSGQVLSSTASGTDWIDGTAIPGVPDGSGTAGKIVMWQDSDTLTDSKITQTAGSETNYVDIDFANVEDLTITGDSSFSTFTVNAFGAINFSNIENNFNVGSGDLSIATGDSSMSLGTTTADSNTLTAGYTTTRFIGTGNVGIGTTTPTAKLSINSATDVGLPALGASGGSFIDTTANVRGLIAGNIAGGHYFMQVQRIDTTATAYNLLLQPNGGNVGIGTTSPAYKLDVQGQIRLKNPNHQIIFHDTDSGVDEWSITTYANTGLAFYDGATSGSPILNLLSGGNVGIGTTSPAYLLDVNEDDNVLAFRVTGGGGGAPIASFIRDVGATGSQVNINAQSNFPQIQFTNTGNTFSIGGDTSGNFKISDANAIGTNDRITIDNTGNVGIGITAPVSKLHVYNNDGQTSTAAGITVEQDGTGDAIVQYLLTGLKRLTTGIDNSDGDKFKISQDIELGTNNVMTLTTAGNVGIGTTSPSEKLTISGGNLLVAGDYQSLYVGGKTDSSQDGIRMSIDNAGNGYFDHRGAGNLNFRVDASNGATTRMVIEDTGNVGIGTTSPAAKLEVEGGDHLFQISTSSSTGNPYMSFNQAGTRRSFIQHADSGDTLKLVSEYGGIDFYTGTSGSETEKMTIESGGNVGIGTNSPDAILHASKSSANADVPIILENSGQSGTSTASLVFAGNGGGGVEKARIKAAVYGDGYMSFHNNDDSEKMRIAANGNVGIGQTNPSTYKLDVSGTIRATGDVIAYSDIRVKENITTIEKALDKVKKLRGVEYNKIDNTEKSIGVIAQEIEEVIPEVVREDDQGMKSVAYGNITAVLIEAIKEQQNQIDELKNQLDAFTK